MLKTLLVPVLVLAASAALAAGPEWKVYNRRDKVTDKGFAQVEATTADVSIMLQCAEKTPPVIVLGVERTVFVHTSRATVRFVGADKPAIFSVFPNTNGRKASILGKDARCFYEGAVRGDFSLRVDSYDGPRSAEFSKLDETGLLGCFAK